MTIGQQLREARDKAGLTQQNVADRLFVSRSLIACWETGRRDPKITQVLAFGDAVGANITCNLKEVS